MGSVIGEILPLAVGIAISPIPIIAAILMLLSPKAKATSVGFLLGWLAGILPARRGQTSSDAAVDVRHRLHDCDQGSRAWLPALGDQSEEPAAGDFGRRDQRRGGPVVGCGFG